MKGVVNQAAPYFKLPEKSETKKTWRKRQQKRVRKMVEGRSRRQEKKGRDSNCYEWEFFVELDLMKRFTGRRWVTAGEGK